MLQVVFRRAADGDEMAVARKAFLRYGNIAYAGKELPRDGILACADFVRRARDDEMAAVFAGGGAEIDDEIGGAHRVEIVFDDDDRVAKIAEACERRDELVVVPLVKADARFVQNIEDADEAGADLRGEADALRFAAGQGTGLSVERQVIEPD